MPDLSTLTGRLLDIELGSEDSTVLFTTARREAAVNEGIREFADLTECFRRSRQWTVTSTALFWNLLSTDVGSTDYVRLASERGPAFFIYSSLGSTQVRVLAGEELPQRSLRYMDVYEPNWQAQQLVTSSAYRTPDRFLLGGTQIAFWPRPSTSGSSAVFSGHVDYVAFPPRLTAATDVPYTVDGVIRYDLRPYHQAAVHYAAAQLEKLRKNIEGVQQQTQMFLSYVQRYLTANRPRGGTAITTTRQYLRERPLRGRGTSEDPRT